MASIAGLKAENAALRSELITLRHLRAQDQERIKWLEKHVNHECEHCKTTTDGERTAVQTKLQLENV